MNKHAIITAIALAMTAFFNHAFAEDHSAHMDYCGHEVHESKALRDAARQPIRWKKPSHTHKDKTVSFKILGINDFHGALETRSLLNRPVGGAAVLASYLEAATAASDNGAIIVHAGDHVGATPPISALLQDEPSIQFLNLLGNRNCRSRYPMHPGCNLVGTLGNHEFDEGVAEMLRLIRGGNHEDGPFLQDDYDGARFPYINANVVYETSGRPVLPPYVIKSIAGVRVAFIGAVLKETPTIVTPTGVAGVAFLDEAAAINRLVPKLQHHGIKAIVVTIHQGTRQTAFAGSTPTTPADLDGAIGEIVKQLDDEIDIVVSGHAHGFTNQFMQNNTGATMLVTQAFANGTAYSDIDVVVDKRSGDIVEMGAEVVTTWADEGAGLLPDSAVAEMVAAAAERVQPLVEQVIGTAAAAITRTENAAGESALGNLIADAQRSALSTDVAFMNPGGIRDDLSAGETTWGELFSIQPFANDLVRMQLTGAQIIELLNQQWSGANAERVRILKTSGITYRWDASLPPAQRVLVESVLINGIPVAPDALYSVTVNSFIAAGGDNFTVLTQGNNPVIGPVDLDALINYIADQPQPFNASVEGRIIRVN